MLIPIENYIPHRHGMRLIDSIVEVNDEHAICTMKVNKDNLFYDDAVSGMMSWVSIELMAQTVAVFAGYQCKKTPPDIGLLLSVRKFISTQPYYPINHQLMIKATKIYLEDNVGVFQCEIYINDQLVASARLNTLQPDPQKIANLLSGEPS